MGEYTAFTGMTLIDGTGSEPAEQATLVVNGDTIEAVGAASEVRVPGDARVVDASGATMIPGLIDAHCHLGGANFPDENDWVLEDDRYQAMTAVAQAERMLRHGFTSVRDISVHGLHLHKAIKAGLVRGPRIIGCWRGLSRTGGHGDAEVPANMVRTSHPWGIVADGVEEVRKVTREIVKNGSMCIKVWASGGGLHENEPEDAQHYSYEELRVMVEEATFAKLPVCAHCECDSSALDAAKAGVWSIEHGEDLGEETVALMAEKGISLVPTLELLRQWFEWSGEGGYYGNIYVPGGGDDLPTDKDSLRKIHHGRLSQNMLNARDAGVRIALGSDSFCTSLTPYGEQSLNELHDLVSYGLSPMEALVAATRSGAEVLKIEAQVGTLQAGKCADLVLLRRNPLEDITCVVEPEMLVIMKEGEFVKDCIR